MHTTYEIGRLAALRGDPCPPDEHRDFLRGHAAALLEQERLRVDSMRLTGLRAGLRAAQIEGGMSLPAFDEGYEEGLNARRLIAAQTLEANEGATTALVAEVKALREWQEDERGRLRRREAYAQNKGLEWAARCADRRGYSAFADELRADKEPCPDQQTPAEDAPPAEDTAPAEDTGIRYHLLKYPAKSPYQDTPCKVVGSLVWGFSVYNGVAGYRTLGVDLQTHLQLTGATLRDDFDRMGQTYPDEYVLRVDKQGNAYAVAPSVLTSKEVDQVRALLRSPEIRRLA